MDQQTEPARATRLSAARPNAKRPTLRQRAYIVLEEGQSEGGPSRVIEIVLIALILSNVAMVILETVPSIYGPYRWYFRTFEIFTVCAFATEYAARVWSTPEDPRIGWPIRSRTVTLSGHHVRKPRDSVLG